MCDDIDRIEELFREKRKVEKEYQLKSSRLNICRSEERRASVDLVMWRNKRIREINDELDLISFKMKSGIANSERSIRKLIVDKYEKMNTDDLNILWKKVREDEDEVYSSQEKGIICSVLRYRLGLTKYAPEEL